MSDKYGFEQHLSNMADMYSKLLGLSETNPPDMESGKAQPAQLPKQKVKKTSKPAN